jgi:SAM-dependent methyltransferase
VSSFAQLSGFYDLDYPDRSDHVFLSRLVSAVDPGHLLEIPCGSGRNVAPLLGATSRKVTFVDVAETMVDETDRRIPKSERYRAKAVVGDMTSLGPIGPFDLVICPREAFQLLSRAEAAQALASMAASTAAEGLVVIDLFTFTRGRAAPSDAPPDYFSPTDRGWVEDWTRTAADGGRSVTRRRRQSFRPDGVHFEMHYSVRTSAEPDARFIDLAFDMTNYSPDGFRQLAERSGLVVLAALAGYGDVPAATSRSLRTVFVLARHRHQQGSELLDRIHKEIAVDRAISQSDGPDAGRPGRLDVRRRVPDHPST